jgi:glucose/arabinose dehydrogenase
VADHIHASTADLPDRWVRTDEWYNYTLNPRGDVHVLATLDETTYTGGTQGFDHPISWYKYFEGGRSWYTGLGHTASSYAEPLFLDHLLGGIQFAAGRAPADLGGTIDANWQKAELATGLSNPISLAVAPSGDVYFVELGGRLKIYHPSTGLTTTAATLNVFAQGEDGLLGIALDPNFARNQWVYLYYSPAGPEEVQHLSRLTMNGSMLDLSSEQVVLEIPVTRVQNGQSDGHSAGSLAFGPGGVLYVSVGDDTVPFESSGYAPIDEQAGRQRFDAQRSSSNTNDLRGKILRIKPEVDGSYSIPAGNLFTGDATHRPEIFVMGNRNPYRISVDAETGWLYWGDVGPDANNDSAMRGPRGYDEINQAREAGNYGWPYIIADNKAYRDFNFATSASGPLFDPAALQNDSPNNTGSLALPTAKPAFIWYPYAASSEFPELGSGARTIMAGPVYHFDPQLNAENKLPEYFDHTLIMFDWSRSWFWEVKLDQNGQLLKINRIFSELAFKRPIETELGPDGALYVLEWGTNFGGNNPDAKLVRVDFVGNLPNLSGDYNKNNLVDAADYTVWRDTLGQSGLTPFAGADGSGNGVVDMADYNVWNANFGRTAPVPVGVAGDYNQNGVVDAADYSVWRDTLGSTSDLRADGSDNGIIDVADYDLWKTHFGQTLPGSAAGSGSTAASVATAALKSAINDPIMASQLPASPVGNVALAVSIAPTSPWSEPGADRRLHCGVVNTLPDASFTRFRQNNTLLDWLAPRAESKPRHDDMEVAGFVDDRAADKSIDSLFGAVDEVFEALSKMPAVESHQFASA